MDNAEIKYLTCDDSNVLLKAAYKKQFDAAVLDSTNCMNNNKK